MVKTEKYVPEYVPGEILVSFKVDDSASFAKDFGKGLGYELTGEYYEYGDCFIYKTEKGKEKDAIAHFSKYPEFVDWASLRDKKIESRWKSLDEVVDRVNELNDDVEISDKAYSQKINKIINYLKHLK